jgi:phage terminase large subunit
LTQVDVSQALYAVEAAIAGRVASQGLPPPVTARSPYTPHNWPPDYGRVHAWRRQTLASFERDPTLLEDARAYYAGEDLAAADGSDAYAERCLAFVNGWVDTYDPRLIGTGRPARMPMILFQRQEELVRFVLACMLGDAPGLVEKSRDMGATWVCSAVTVWAWTFWPGFVAGWGSNKAEQVDVIGNPKSIFEKLRMLIRGLPEPFRPDVSAGVDLKQHTCRNSQNGAVIDGEIGANIGRGGRSRIYFVDEAAHLEHPEQVEASLSENTRCRMDISSVSGPNTVFYRKRQAGKEWSPGAPVRRDVANVFVMDWSEHPEKTKEWYADRRSYYAAQGTSHVVAREIDRDYMGAAEGIIIPYEHVEAAVDAHKALDFDDSGGWWGGLDLADEGPDKNALIRGRGVVVKYAEEINDRDPGAVARQAFRACRETSPLTLQYDSGGGFGGSVKSEFNRLTQDEGIDVSWLTLIPWSAAAKVVDPGEPIIKGDKSAPTNKNFFENFKAQAWWNIAQVFHRTWQARNSEAEYEPGQLISLDSSTIPPAVLTKLMRELSQATMGQSTRLKLVVDKAPEGAKSPNLADALIMGRFPARQPMRGSIGLFGPKVFTA